MSPLTNAGGWAACARRALRPQPAPQTPTAQNLQCPKPGLLSNCCHAWHPPLTPVDNPARVAPAQRKYIAFPEGQRFQPIRPAPSGAPACLPARRPCCWLVAWQICFAAGWQRAAVLSHRFDLRALLRGKIFALSLNLPSSPPARAPAGFVLLKDTQPEAGPAEYLFQEAPPAAAAPAADAAAFAPAAGAPAAEGAAADEPPPPEPFEYIPS